MNTSAHHILVAADHCPSSEGRFLNGRNLRDPHPGLAVRRARGRPAQLRGRPPRHRPHRARDRRGAQGSRDLVLIGMRTRGVPMARRLAETIGRSRATRSPSARSMSACTATTFDPRADVCTSSPATCRRSPASASCSSTTCSTPAARSAPRSTPSSTTAGPAHPARGAGRPRPPRAADPRGLRGQEHPDVARRRRAGAPRRDRRPRRGRRASRRRRSHD